jgi:uncharacterized membrane protein
VDLVCLAAAAALYGGDLLQSTLDAWPKMLAFLTSFTFIANSWVGHNMQFHHVRRVDGGLMWIAFLQLPCIAFMPSPTVVISEHVRHPAAE